MDALKIACKRDATENFYETKITHSHDGKNGRYILKCKDPDCSWTLHVGVIPDTKIYRISKLSEGHTCRGVNHRGHGQATAKLVADTIIDKIRDMPEYKPIDIIKDYTCDHGVTLTYSKALRAKEIALETINGSFADGYRLLPQYFEKLKVTNPGSTIELESTAENKFRRVFLSFGAQGAGFVQCRAIIGLDGTHWKSRYQGILLSVTGVDARGIYSSKCQSLIVRTAFSHRVRGGRC